MSGGALTALRIPGRGGPIPLMTPTSATNAPTTHEGLERLSPRQVECLALAATGLTSAEIAARLRLSPRTVDEHLMGACRTLGVRTRIQAVALRALHERRMEESRSFLP